MRKTLLRVMGAALFAGSTAADCAAQSAAINVLPGLSAKQATLTYQARINPTVPATVAAVQSVVSASAPGAPPVTPQTATTTVVPLGQFLSSPVHFLWNGFLAMQNVVGMLNRDTNPLPVKVRMLNQEGTELSAIDFVIPPTGEYDLAVNLLPGFNVNSLGVLQVEFTGSDFDGNGFFYRFARDGRALEFMTGSTFETRLLGPSFVSYNTVQPSRRDTQLANEVTNWLAISNLDQAAAKTFAVELYDPSGNLLVTNSVSVPARGRRDLAAGHQNPGPGHVGLVRIVPSDNTAPYTANLIRYGASAPTSALAKFYHFSVLTQARRSSSTFEWGMMSRGGDGENWIVLSNASNSPGDFNVAFVSNSGSLLSSIDVHLEAFAQIHLFANGVLAPSQSGAVRVTALTANSFVAESDFYFYDRSNGELTAAYASGFRKPSNTEAFGSYNNFLGQFDYLKTFNINNTTGPTVLSTLTLNTSSGIGIGSAGIAMQGEEGLELALHDLPFAPAVNSYGPLSLTDPTLSIIAEVLRVQYVNGRIKGVQSIPLR